MRAASNNSRSVCQFNYPKYLTAGQIKERFGVSDRELWHAIRCHGFPRSVRFGAKGSRRFWHVTNVKEWERQHRFWRVAS